ncbi:MAG: hypothetical protein IPM23_16850 [Candidatus Melainabacteria bacterium]|nr:hypothetical protein [Candidatus Melainabacteria bacterium]
MVSSHFINFATRWSIIHSMRQAGNQATGYRKKQRELMDRLEAQSLDGSAPVFTVPRESDYATSDELCLTLLGFLSPVVSERIQALIESFREVDPAQYYYLPESLHLTVQNVRRISKPPSFGPDEIDAACRVFRSRLAGLAPLSFELCGFIRLKNSLSVAGFASDGYPALIRSLKEGLELEGIADDKRYMSDDVIFGNVTISRFSAEPSAAFDNRLASIREESFGELVLERLSLVVTNSVCHPRATKVIEEYVLL